MAVLPEQIPQPKCSFLRCLPSAVRDPLGRPIVIIKLAALLASSDEVRPALTQYIELLRRHLEVVNSGGEGARGDSEIPVLQYVALIDIGGISVQSVVRLYCGLGSIMLITGYWSW